MMGPGQLPLLAGSFHVVNRQLNRRSGQHVFTLTAKVATEEDVSRIRASRNDNGGARRCVLHY